MRKIISFVNEGPNLNKGYKAYDIVAVDSITLEKLAWYTGYYFKGAKIYKLYPNNLTNIGRYTGYKMEKQTIRESQLLVINL